MLGWYHGLNDVEGYLPTLKNQSWHVEVFVKPVGWASARAR
jgi:hypothetical protein